MEIWRPRRGTIPDQETRQYGAGEETKTPLSQNRQTLRKILNLRQNTTPKLKSKLENIASTKHPKRTLHDETPNAENKAKLAE